MREDRSVTEPPAMFRRPTDPPDPLPPIRSSETITGLHAEWARQHAGPAPENTWSNRLRNKARAVRGRIGVGTDPQLLGDLVRAVDAVAARCDELSERASHLEIVVDDLARILGEEVTRLRAAVAKSSKTSAESSPSGP